MIDTRSQRMRAAGVTTVAGLGVATLLAIGGDGGGAATDAERAGATGGSPALDASHRVGSTTPADATLAATPAAERRAGWRLGREGAATGAADDATGGDNSRGGATGTGGAGPGPDGSGGADTAPGPNQIEIVVPHRIVITMPQYQPGTAPTVRPPALASTPPGVSHDDDHVTVELPDASWTPPSVDDGEPGRFTPPSVEPE